MFSTQEYLDKKTGPYGIGRLSYLQSLVTEFQDTDSQEAKEQVLANLSNFAYDPINYEYIRQLKIIDLFLDTLEACDGKMQEFAIGGLCNLCLDKKNKEYILQNNGVQLVKHCLSSTTEETVLSAITTLMYLVTPSSKTDITSIHIIDAMRRFSRSNNARLKNLAEIFLTDYCTKDQISAAQLQEQQWKAQIQAQALSSLHNKGST